MRFLRILKATFKEFLEDKCPRMAAALAYYTMFSLAPLLVIVMWICGVIFDPSDIRGQIASELRSVVGEDGAKQVQTMVSNVNQPGKGWSSVIGVAALLFGATGVMVQLQEALNQAWDAEPDPDQSGIVNFLTKRMISFGMLLGIAFLLIVSLILSWALRAIGSTIGDWLPGQASQWIWMAGHELLLMVILVSLFAVLFRYLPDVDVAWRDVWIGAAITAVLFALGKFGIGLYLGSRDLGSTYGAAGSLVLILVWVYYSSMIFLFGAEFTQVWARRSSHDDPFTST